MIEVPGIIGEEKSGGIEGPLEASCPVELICRCQRSLAMLRVSYRVRDRKRDSRDELTVDERLINDHRRVRFEIVDLQPTRRDEFPALAP